MKGEATPWFLWLHVLLTVAACGSPSPPAAPPVAARAEPRIAIVELQSRQGRAELNRSWQIVPTSPPLLFSQGELLDARTGAYVWTWKGAESELLAARPDGDGRDVELLISDGALLPTWQVVVADVSQGRELSRRPLTGGRAEALRFATTPPIAAHIEVVHIEGSSDRWRVVRDRAASRYTSMLEAPVVLYESKDEVLVLARQCIDKGDRLPGRLLMLDDNLELRRTVSLPEWRYRTIERAPGTLRLLSLGFELECSSPSWSWTPSDDPLWEQRPMLIRLPKRAPWAIVELDGL